MVRLVRGQHCTGNVIRDKGKTVGSITRRFGGWTSHRSIAPDVQVVRHAKLDPGELEVDGAAVGHGVREELELLQGLVCVAGIASTHVKSRLLSLVLVGALPCLRVKAYNIAVGDVAGGIYAQRHCCEGGRTTERLRLEGGCVAAAGPEAPAALAYRGRSGSEGARDGLGGMAVFGRKLIHGSKGAAAPARCAPRASSRRSTWSSTMSGAQRTAPVA